MFLIGFLAVVVIAAFLAVQTGLPKINVVTILLAIWAPLAILASCSAVLRPTMSQGTWILVWLGISGLISGAMLAGSVRPKPPSERNQQLVSININTRLLVRIHLLLCVQLLLYVAWQLYRIPKAFGFRFTDLLLFLIGRSGGASSFRYANLSQQSGIDSTALTSTTAIEGMISLFLFIGNVSIFTGALLWVASRRVISLVPLLLSALLSVALLQRYTFLMALTFFVLALAAFKAALRGPAPVASRWLSRAIIALTCILVIAYPLAVRTSGSVNAAHTLIPYYVAGIGSLNCSDRTDSIATVDFISNPGMVQATPGANTFKDLFIVLDRLGLPVVSAPRGFLDMACNFQVFGETTPSFVYTSFYDFWLDFGTIGVFLIALALGLIATVAQRLAWSGRLAWVPIFSYCFGQILWSFSANYFLQSLRYLLLALISTYVLTKLPQLKGGSPAGSASHTSAVTSIALPPKSA